MDLLLDAAPGFYDELLEICDSDSDDEAAAIAAAVGAVVATVAVSSHKRPRARGGSRPGKRPNRSIDRLSGALRIDRDFFCRMPVHAGLDPVFTRLELERRHRAPRYVYEEVRRGLLASDDKFFVQKEDCCGVMGASRLKNESKSRAFVGSHRPRSRRTHSPTHQ